MTRRRELAAHDDRTRSGRSHQCLRDAQSFWPLSRQLVNHFEQYQLDQIQSLEMWISFHGYRQKLALIGKQSVL